MSTIEKSIEVNVPVRTAYNQWTQFEEFPRFMQGIKSVKQLDDTHVHWHAEIAGVDREWDAEIVEQVPDRRIAWRSVSGARNDGIVEFTPVGSDRTRLTVRLEYEPQGIAENVGDMANVPDRRVQGDMERFKQFIESRGQETGGWRGTVH
jgi:uncharacterized membrane protein